MLAMNLFFWDGWNPAPPVAGQSPAATRYRSGYRANTVTGVITSVVVAAVVLWP